MFYGRMPDLEHKVALIQATREMMQGFLDSMEELETDALYQLRENEEFKQPE